MSQGRARIGINCGDPRNRIASLEKQLAKLKSLPPICAKELT